MDKRERRDRNRFVENSANDIACGGDDHIDEQDDDDDDNHDG